MVADDILKAREHAIEKALNYLQEAEVVALGTGSTVRQLIETAHSRGLLRDKALAVSSYDTALHLANYGYRVLSPLSVSGADVYLDSADEVDRLGRMIKGGGGALTQEKILAYYSRMKVYIVDWLKLVNVIGEKHPLPVEVLPLAASMILKRLKDKGFKAVLRESRSKKGPTLSDSGGFIIDVYVKGDELIDLESWLRCLPGVVETGLFANLHNVILIGYPNGSVKELLRPG